jgi:hypothetical protein
MISLQKIIEKITKNKHEIFLLLFSIMIFMIIQTIFFNFIISKEYNEVLKEKMNSIKYFFSNNKNLKIKFDKFKDDYLLKHKKIAEEQTKKREDINTDLYIKHCVIPILIVFVIIIIFLFVYLLDTKYWSFVHIFNLFLILIVYIPEFIIYFLVIKKYQYIGNTEIIYNIYKKINTNKS